MPYVSIEPLYRLLASAIDARARCDANANSEGEQRWHDRIEHAARTALPSGSGFDSGTTIDLDRSTGEKIVMQTAFHHMSEHGYYDGWTEHSVTVRPSLMHGFTVMVGGRNRNDIKDFISDDFQHALGREYRWTESDEIEEAE